MNQEASVKKDEQSIPKLMMYYASILADDHWEDFENAFFNLDPQKPKPQRYLDADFDPQSFRFKMTAFFYWLIFSGKEVPPEIKEMVKEWSATALQHEAVKEKMDVFTKCMHEFQEVVKEGGSSKIKAWITSP